MKLRNEEGGEYSFTELYIQYISYFAINSAVDVSLRVTDENKFTLVYCVNSNEV